MKKQIKSKRKADKSRNLMKEEYPKTKHLHSEIKYSFPFLIIRATPTLVGLQKFLQKSNNINKIEKICDRWKRIFARRIAVRRNIGI